MLILVEGSTDVDFLEPVIPRALNDLVLEHVEPVVYIDCDVKVAPSRAPREQSITSRVAGRPGTDIVALHFDGTADVDRERAKYLQPVAQAWKEAGLDGQALLIEIVPVREMEAWALGDRDVLDSVIGRAVPVEDIHEGDKLDTPEQLADPKRTLADLMAASRRKRRAKADPHTYLPILGERMPLASLRRLNSFNAFESELVHALRTMGWTR